MHIGVDGNEANVEKKVGVSVYTHELLVHFRKYANASCKFRVYLKHPPNSQMPTESDYFQYQVIPGNIAWSRFHFPIRLMKEKLTGLLPDVLFAPAHYSPWFCPLPLVVTIHDLSYLTFPNEFLRRDLYKLTKWTKKSLSKAKKVIAVSKRTKKDIVHFYNISENIIEVIYNGFQQPKRMTSKTNILKTYSLSKHKYVLYVGTLQPRKNIGLLIEAFHKFRKTHPEFKLVLVGKKGWKYDDLMNQINSEKNIVVTGYETWDHLSQLYQSAYCFVLPSLYEGFGIPILEAMSFETPVISSQASSLPEIGGSACLYFDPTDSTQLVEELEELFKNDLLRKKLIHAGKTQVKTFSWKKSAQETLSVLTSITT